MKMTHPARAAQQAQKASGAANAVSSSAACAQQPVRGHMPAQVSETPIQTNRKVQGPS